MMTYLYEELDNAAKHNTAISNTHIPHIEDNLSPRLPIRDYQIKAFSRFDYFLKADFDGKQNKPYHLLYNMATGSGKTLVMAGLVLYLFEKGYRNFLFFVNSKNIIKKTKENFLNPKSFKYLFNNEISINGKKLFIKEIDTFDTADDKNINLKFTTIQQLHTDLELTIKENSVSYEDFKDKKIVLIADEAHHFSASTKKQELEEKAKWEGTVVKILNQNIENILLEFTATLDYSNQDISNKYQDKVIYKYDLAQFRNDKFSKEISLIRTNYKEEERILQALILNQYRQELAADNNVNLKPVILFKAKRTIKESEKNKEKFHKLIDNLTYSNIDNIRTSSGIPIIGKAFDYFKEKKINSALIANRIKENFKFENCISANSDDEAEMNQILLNTLEDENNPIRAVFAVMKLNEGWDVLNLFDIVRLYESRDSKGSKAGKTTISEAQLIGRGARYFPFKIKEGDDKFTRKYDGDIENNLKVIEELYYHTKEDSKYISELKKALIESGIYEDEDNMEIKQLTLKPDFKKSDFYKNGKVVFNKKIEKNYAKVKSFSDLGVVKSNFSYNISSGIGIETAIFKNEKASVETTSSGQRDVKLSEIPNNVIQFALSKNPFFNFSNLKKFFPNLKSQSEFISSENYLRSLEITFKGDQSQLIRISNLDFLLAVIALLEKIEKEIKSNLSEYEGSEFFNEGIKKIFNDKQIKVRKNSVRADGQEDVVSDKQWYVYNANYGTAEEKKFVELFSRLVTDFKKIFDTIYLIRNEREIKIVDKSGRAFEPDFILFCHSKRKEKIVYQVFIEPKGEHLEAKDKWKEEFLLELRENKKTIHIKSNEYIITAVPFYSNRKENFFKNDFRNTFQ
ncbi:MAG: hypothetical protein HGGPFJEG_01207 [Ignavibacteria bacterium]|nr:hypothetical protein [Ignavibacteria bacterium]